MSSYPVQRYPSPRPALSLEEFIEFYATAEKYDYVDDHFETRATYAEYCLWILREPKRWLLDRLTLAEVANVLHTMPTPIGDARLPLELRLDIARADIHVFKEVFEPLVGFSTEDGAAQLESVCFMWWDNCAYEDPVFAEIFRAEADALLWSSNPAVRESALHGLGHHIFITQDVEAIKLIDDYLSTAQELKSKEVKYAEDARRGNVL